MLTFICIVLFVAGAISLARDYFKPGKSDFWNKNREPVQRRRVIIGYLVFAIIVTAIVYFIDSDSSGPKPVDRVLVGEVFHSRSFDIVVNKFNVTDQLHIDIENRSIDEKAPAGEKYLVINLTFKNKTSANAYVGLGTLKINDNGTVAPVPQAHIWNNGINAYNVDPLASKIADLVFRLPAETAGEVYWHPDEQGNNKDIYLGEIKERHAHVHVPED